MRGTDPMQDMANFTKVWLPVEAQPELELGLGPRESAEVISLGGLSMKIETESQRLFAEGVSRILDEAQELVECLRRRIADLQQRADQFESLFKGAQQRLSAANTEYIGLSRRCTAVETSLATERRLNQELYAALERERGLREPTRDEKLLRTIQAR